MTTVPKIKFYEDSIGDENVVRETIAEIANVDYRTIDPKARIDVHIKTPADTQELVTNVCKKLFGDSKEVPGFGTDGVFADDNCEEAAASIRGNAVTVYPDDHIYPEIDDEDNT